ncbi:MAG TPA: phosphoribosylamine--glycine ligase [Bryobacteraceae bacterium]|nr:phosphoribosylamine--glycine ligase [Bryobacteraceae bacterium]
MKILIIGSGGREHALAWKLAQNRDVTLYAAPGNPGIAQVATCVPLAEKIRADLTIVGPEAPLADGIVDRFRSAGLAIVGPTAAAARLESSKAFAKDLMQRTGIPTARHATAASQQQALDALKRFSLPVVIKADGLATGKGVIIAQTEDEATRAVLQLLTPDAQVVIEEFLVGEEASFIVLTDGTNVLPLEPSQDHKAVNDGDTGPNTGGMGAYSDGRILSEAQKREVLDRVIHPMIQRMRDEGNPFTGFLYAGLMMTGDGPKVLEFNARLGDPETQALMHRMSSDFVAPLEAAAHSRLTNSELEWRPEPSVCVVIASAGYPATPRTGDVITGLDEAAVADSVVFQAGTKIYKNVLETSGGRVLGVTARGPDLSSAIQNTYKAVEHIRFDGMHYRRDIGRKGLTRW